MVFSEELYNILHFPHPLAASDHGFLYPGGELTRDRLILAYRMGIFPWYSDDDPIMWWVPMERFVIDVGKLHVPKSMRRYLNNPIFQVTVDEHFDYIIARCKRIHRPGQSGTWITDDMQAAYQDLNAYGLAHSIEVWYENEIIGGLYGVGTGRIFSGESMFCDMTDASKFAVIILDHILRQLGYTIIDCQQYSRHLQLLGGYSITRKDFHEVIRKNLLVPLSRKKWGSGLIPELFRKKTSS